MNSTIIQIQNLLSKIAGQFKLVLITLLVFALVSAPYSFDLNKGKLTVSYAIAKDGDDDERETLAVIRLQGPSVQ